MTLMVTILTPLRKPSRPPRPPTTESPSSLSATPSLVRVWKKPREPTPLTEKPVSHTLKRPRRTLAFPKERAGTFLKEPVITTRVSKRRTRPPTMNGKRPSPPGRRPTLNLPSNSMTPSTTMSCPPKTCVTKSLKWVMKPKPPVFLETRSSKRSPASCPTTFLDPPIFTDLPVTTSTTEETSELVSTRATPERIFTSESANTPWDPS
mmetsp:Transcript_18727/g.25964  ORF Transcript_18727/g.25964 Transcript_18727/m.25964 type:complete len:207 (-) Transcript_18727:964-1584(-)